MQCMFHICWNIYDEYKCNYYVLQGKLHITINFCKKLTMIYILNIRAKSTIVIIFALFTLGTNLILLILYERKFYAYACLAHIFVRVYPCHHASMRHHISTTLTLHPAPFSYLILQLHIVLKTHACKLIVLMEPFSKHYYSIKSVRVWFPPLVSIMLVD